MRNTLLCFYCARWDIILWEGRGRSKSSLCLAIQVLQHILWGVWLCCTHRVPCLTQVQWMRNLASSCWVTKGKDNQWVVIHMYTYGGYATQRGACLWPSLRRARIAPALSLLLSWLSCASLLVVFCIPCRCFPHVISWLFFKWFLSGRDRESTHGNICSNNFSKQTADGIAASFWSCKKNPVPVVLL